MCVLPFPLPPSPFPFITALLLLVRTAPLLAQVDPSGPWRTWHTPHFRIHAPATAESLAIRAAAAAEYAYTQLAGELVPPRGKVDVALGGNVDFSNAFTSIYPSNRLTVFVTPPAGSPALANYDDWLGLVLTHELLHVFHLDRSRGIWRVGQAIFGRLPGLFPNAYRPSWVSEGLATYYESRFTTSGRMRGGLHPQLLAAATGDRWPGPHDATLVSPKWPAGFLPYAWGSYFFQWQSDHHGDSVVPGFIERTSRRLWPLTTSGPLKSAGGRGVGEAWRAIRDAWADSVGSTSGERHAGSARLLARGLRAEPRPHLSPDGRYLAYVHADGRDDPRLVVRDVATGVEAWRRRVNAGVDLAWVDSALVVAQLDFSSPVEIRSRLHRWVPGGSWAPVPGSERLARPFAGPGGRAAAVDLDAGAARLVSVSGRGRGRNGSPEPLAAPAADAWAYVDVSPDGSWLAGARHANGQWDIVLWRPGRPDELIQVTEDPPVDDDPTWVPAGDRLLFTSERGWEGIPQIFAFRPSDRSLEQVTWEPAGARQPAITADGKLIYVTVLPDGYAVVERPLPEGRPAAPAGAGAAVTPPAAVEARETGFAPWPSLQPHFWVPTWHDEGRAGRFAGGLIAGTDAIGRTSYVAQLALSSRGRVEALLDVEHRRWKRFGLEASVQQTWDGKRVRVILQQPVDTVPVLLGERELTVSGGGVFRWRRWRSSITARAAAEWEQDGLVIDSSPVPLRLSRPTTNFVGPVVSLGLVRATQPPLAISPEHGATLGLLYRRRWELGGTEWFDEARASASAYLALPLPGFAHWVLAARGAAGASGGPAAPTFEIGGVSGDRFGLFPGHALGTGRRQFPLRGYPVIAGFTRVAMAAVELRIPVALIARGLWILPIGLDRISLTAFAETGGTWSAQQAATPFEYRDVGGEAVVDLAIWYDVPLRLRVGAGVPLTTPPAVAGSVVRGRPRGYLTFGTAF